jgi:hypothetical protein
MSQITGASLGVYLAKTGGACGGSGLFAGGDPYGGCGQTTGGQTIAGLTSETRRGPVAEAEFEFSVTADGVQVYDFTGVETVTNIVGAIGLQVNPLAMTLNGNPVSSGVLTDLMHLQPGAPGSADGYMWGDSNLDISLGGLLAAGASRDIVYTATVTTFSNVNCATSDPTVCLVPYAAFGDPIGKGGGTNGAFQSFARTTDSGTDGIEYVDNWGPQTFATPTFSGGVLSFLPAGGVPEPKTWMSLILGFGLLGATLRRRRVLSYT